jgi:hypothetical protein
VTLRPALVGHAPDTGRRPIRAGTNAGLIAVQGLGRITMRHSSAVAGFGLLVRHPRLFNRAMPIRRTLPDDRTNGTARSRRRALGTVGGSTPWFVALECCLFQI